METFRENYKIGSKLICIRNFTYIDNFSEFYEDFYENKIYEIKYHYNIPVTVNSIKFKDSNLFIGENDIKLNFATITELRKIKLDKIDKHSL